MKPFRLGEIVSVAGARLAAGDPGAQITGITYDSRTAAPGCLFVAVPGEKQDGHAWCRSAVERGASALLVAKPVDGIGAGVAVLEVPDTLAALGALAGACRARFSGPVVAVTGTHGKTTTKELLGHLLSGRFRTVTAVKSFNNQYGVAHTLFRVAHDTEAVVMELGTNAPGEIATLARLVRPTVAVVTRADVVHLEGMGSLERIREEKASLLDYVAPEGTAWVNGDDEPLLAVCRTRPVKLQLYGWEKEGPRDLRGRSVSATDRGIALEWDGKILSVPLLGLFSASNVLAAVAVARTLGLTPEAIAGRLATFEPPEGRMKLVAAGGCRILDDTYNSNPLAMREAVKQLLALSRARRRLVVMADMLELGAAGPALHRELGAWLGRQGLAGLWTVGPLARQAGEAAIAAGMAASAVTCCDEKETLFRQVAGALLEGDAVLFKGSRKWALDEEVVKCCTICCTR